MHLSAAIQGGSFAQPSPGHLHNDVYESPLLKNKIV